MPQHSPCELAPPRCFCRAYKKQALEKNKGGLLRFPHQIMTMRRNFQLLFLASGCAESIPLRRAVTTSWRGRKTKTRRGFSRAPLTGG